MGRERVRATLAAIPDLIFEIDHRGYFVGFHMPEGSALFAPPERFIGRPLEEVTSLLEELAREGFLQRCGAAYSVSSPQSPSSS